MVALVQAAESEIDLSKHHNRTQEEREAVVNALNGFRVLRLDVVAWRERQNLGGTLYNDASFSDFRKQVRLAVEYAVTTDEACPKAFDHFKSLDSELADPR
jgi:hypothetical protein